ncbi:DNA polymerase III subunit delta [Qipengyuania sediminis]|uniref:DNA polymerase III subunit delta n=1 Tax=Qipengyuania sediminis TaxID=1532023 RepID=UPI00105941C8|nr:DNA polymerase III subunit delta [Qipengyuania sediminis]
MKVTNSDFAAKARVLARDCGIVFFCGPDEAGAGVAANDLVALLPDPGERVELTGADLRADPARLGDEARSTSLFGDARHIWVRVTGEEALPALETLIATKEAGAGAACPVIVMATNATDKSRTAKLLEKRKDAAVAMFYAPDLPAVTQAVRMLGDAAGVQLDAALAERIARAARLDVRLAKSEVEKLALFLDAGPQAPRRADAAALDAIGAPSEDDSFAPLVDAILGGDTKALGPELARMREQAMNPVGTLLAFERRAALLARIAARGSGRAPDSGELIRLGVYRRDQQAVLQQAAIWRGARLARLSGRLVDLHRRLFADNQSAEVLLSQGLTEIARQAARR